MTWYKKGLKFKCTECGQCCTGAPGYVWLSEEDVEEMCALLKIDRKTFFHQYTRQYFGRVSLREDPRTFDCVFLEGKRCKIYKARPKQCRTFPWWPENLASKEAWEETAKRCEGINHPDAPLIPIEKIREQAE